jgi:hypothetical protein
MRRLLKLAGLAAAGAALYRRFGGSGSGSGSSDSPDMTAAPTGADAPSGPTPPSDMFAGRTNLTAQAPADAPGPSVPSPVQPVDRDEPLAPDPERLAEQTRDPVEALVAEEEAKAAAEAAAIGGPAPHDAPDPAMDPVYQAGGGEAEGFEVAERDLVENATHGEGRGKPLADAFTPEAETDLSSAAYGEPDEEDVTEVTTDPDADPGDDAAEAGKGPGRAHDV